MRSFFFQFLPLPAYRDAVCYYLPLIKSRRLTLLKHAKLNYIVITYSSVQNSVYMRSIYFSCETCAAFFKSDTVEPD